MRLTDNEFCFFIERVFDKGVISGFTKPNLDGNLPSDIHRSLAHLGKELSLSYMNQLHSADICYPDKPGVYNGDGIFSGQSNHILVVKTADCLPLLFSSKEKNLIGLVHMGWRSARENIFDKIKGNLASFKVIAGPGLRQCCYKVGNEFRNYLNLEPFIKQKEKSLYFDAISFSREALKKRGLEESNFFDLEICSFCSKSNFPSFRKNSTSRRTLSFILRND